tara:strand:+ start:197 stop:790 length:594 start_codon:yes stop_codon:yes gene_type:complete
METNPLINLYRIATNYLAEHEQNKKARFTLWQYNNAGAAEIIKKTIESVQAVSNEGETISTDLTEQQQLDKVKAVLTILRPDFEAKPDTWFGHQSRLMQRIFDLVNRCYQAHYAAAYENEATRRMLKTKPELYPYCNRVEFFNGRVPKQWRSIFNQLEKVVKNTLELIKPPSASSSKKASGEGEGPKTEIQMQLQKK